jgi:beta-lactamase class A
MVATAFLVLAVSAKPVPTALQRVDVPLRQIAKGFHGRLGYYVKRLDTQESIGFRQDERFPTASTIKTAVALHAIAEIEAGRRKWTDQIPLPNAADRVEYDISEWSYFLKDGVKLDLDGYVNLMLVYSDNLATRVLRQTLGTVNINRTLTDLNFRDTLCLASAPASETRLRRLGGQFGMGVTTPAEMARLLELLYLGKATTPAGCTKLIKVLQKQYWDDWIGYSVPPGVAVASKSGAINRSRSDTAIVFGKVPYVITIYTDSQKDQRWTTDNEGDVALRKMASLVWNALEPQKYSPPAGYDKFLPTGGGIE